MRIRLFVSKIFVLWGLDYHLHEVLTLLQYKIYFVNSLLKVKHVKEDERGSWMWRKLLKLRPLVYEFMRFEVNDGRTAFFWFDD